MYVCIVFGTMYQLTANLIGLGRGVAFGGYMNRQIPGYPFMILTHKGYLIRQHKEEKRNYE